MWDVVVFGCNSRGRVAEGVASYRKVLHLRIQPLIATFDLSGIWGGGRVQQMALKAKQVTAGEPATGMPQSERYPPLPKREQSH